jgi:AcrR family transcriptional regulator
MSESNPSELIPDVGDDDIDPRLIRSRNRLLDAASILLSTGGVEAVTIEAVTKASKVARTTLYRHFRSSSHLLAATFERLLLPMPKRWVESRLRTLPQQPWASRFWLA